MPAPAQYPTPFRSAHPLEPAGPQYSKILDLPPEFVGATVKTFKDGGKSYGLATASFVLVFEISYEGRPQSEADTIIGHYNSANGIFQGFDFRHPRTDVLYSDVHYVQKPDIDHNRTWGHSIKVTLVKAPA